MVTCLYSDCTKAAIARELCRTHYMRVYRDEVRSGERIPNVATPHGDVCTRCGDKFEYQRKTRHRSVCRPCRAADWAWVKFRMSARDVAAFYEEHGNHCDICGGEVSPTQWGNRFMIDHDHVTGKVRGLLCNSCNTGIGSFNDDVELMRVAMVYLVRHRDL